MTAATNPTKVQATDANARPIPGVLRPVADQTRIVTGTADITYGSNQIVRIICTAAASVRFSTTLNGTAQPTTDMYMAANVPEYFRTNPTDYINVSTGTAYITVMG